MISIDRATIEDYKIIVDIGKVSVEEAHRDSSPAKDLNEFLEKNYNHEAIKSELSNEKNIYTIIKVDGRPAGFSKLIFNSEHANIEQKNVAKLDRIYLLREFFDLKLGYELLKFNIDLSKNNNQNGTSTTTLPRKSGSRTHDEVRFHFSHAGSPFNQDHAQHGCERGGCR